MKEGVVSLFDTKHHQGFSLLFSAASGEDTLNSHHLGRRFKPL